MAANTVRSTPMEECRSTAPEVRRADQITLAQHQSCQVVERQSDIGVVWAQHHFSDLKRSLVVRLGLGIVALRAIQPGQIVE